MSSRSMSAAEILLLAQLDKAWVFPFAGSSSASASVVRLPEKQARDLIVSLFGPSALESGMWQQELRFGIAKAHGLSSVPFPREVVRNWSED